jgi:hypothetical protein
VINVILLYPDGMRKEVILSGIPRERETIRLRSGEVLNVEHVLHMESGNGIEPDVLISVRKLPG